ncbi:MAG: hypothetical protein WB622_17000 [Acidobacteriaceae bacterium]
MSEPTTTIPDHHQCRHLKMDGVRCGRGIPLGHTYCYHHRVNRDPSFVRHHGSFRVPLLEDVSSLQVTATAAIHGMLNKSLDPRETRTILYGVQVASGLLRVDLAEKRWLAESGQAIPEPVTRFVVQGHERLAVDDTPQHHAGSEKEGSEAADLPAEQRPCSTLDPEEDFYTPEFCRRADKGMRVPLPPPGKLDPLGSHWPCPYRFEHCKGRGHNLSCHYCSGRVRWADNHPGEPDPGAPGPLPTVNVNWRLVPVPPAPQPALPAPTPEPQPVPEPETWVPGVTPLTDSEEWIDALTPLPDPDPDPVPDPNLVPVLVASADPQPQAPSHQLPAPDSRLPAPDITFAHQQNQKLPHPMPQGGTHPTGHPVRSTGPRITCRARSPYLRPVEPAHDRSPQPYNSQSAPSLHSDPPPQAPPSEPCPPFPRNNSHSGCRHPSRSIARWRATARPSAPRAQACSLAQTLPSIRCGYTATKHRSKPDCPDNVQRSQQTTDPWPLP